ncbi:MAG: ArnT family glycosyltransferase [Planctomyces sp.]
MSRIFDSWAGGIERPSVFRLVLAWSCCTSLCGYYEVGRLQDCMKSPAGILGWFANWNAQTTLPFLVLMLLPLLILIAIRMGWNRSKRLSQRTLSGTGLSRKERPTTMLNGGDSRLRCAVTCLFLGSLSVAMSVCIGTRSITVELADGNVRVPFFRLPPAYHDEYSYLLQAETFLAGRISWPAQEICPDLFHQYHVVNQPRTASRYFPFTGLWMAPFLAAGVPIFGHWLAGGIACVFFYLTLRHLTSRSAAFAGGLLIALSPGLAVFSNLLLAHHPTLLALSIFMWSCIHLLDTGMARFAWICGLSLTAAMLSRPMTAAGFALPYGLLLLSRLLTFRSVTGEWRLPETAEEHEIRPASWFSVISGMGIPLLAGFGVLAFQNQEITGSWKLSAYQHYTDTWTPRHRYGFDNVVKAEEKPAPSDILRSYDMWATNLTPVLAAENVRERLLASILWSLGLIPIFFGLIMIFPLGLTEGYRAGARLMWFSVLSLHAVHVPYWFDGIMHWHYVFETAPLLLMLTILGLRAALARLSVICGRTTGVFWLILLVASVLIPGWLSSETLWGRSHVSMAIGEQSWSRSRMERFRRLIHGESLVRPAIVQVNEAGSDPQLSFIINPADLNSEVLVCRSPRTDEERAELQRAFSDRRFYTFDPGNFVLKEDVKPTSLPSSETPSR